MPLVKSDLMVNRAVTNNDSPANGGDISSAVSVSGVSGNLFPRVTIEERSNGLTRYRKAFHRVSSVSNLTLYDAFLMMFRHTPASDSVTFIGSDFSETQGDVSGTIASEAHYGVGTLTNPATGGDSVIDVEQEQVTFDIYRPGDRIYITDKPEYEGATGSEEFAVIDSVASGGGGVLNITLSSPLSNSYSAGTTRVSSIMEAGDVSASLVVDSLSIAGSGTFDDNEVIVGQRGSLHDIVTIEFTSSTAFTATSDARGSLGTGSRNSTFAPSNTDVFSPYFSIPSSAWGGTFNVGDTVVFETIPAAVPVMYVQNVPAGAGEFSGNSFVMVFGGETE